MKTKEKKSKVGNKVKIVVQHTHTHTPKLC